jgi:hypothetical protein
VGGLELKEVVEGDKQDGESGTGTSRTSHVWDVLHRHILNEKTGEEIWLRVVVDAFGRVLRCTEWTHPYSWYVTMQDDDEAKGFWSETGVASDMAGWQNVINAVVNEIVFNAMRQSRAPILVQDGMFPTDLDGYGDKQFIPVKSLEGAMPLPVQNAVAELMNTVQLCLQFVDTASHSSAAVTGGSSPGPNKTATEEGIKYQGFQLATSDDVAMYGEALIRAARLSLYWITVYWEEYESVYREELAKHEITLDKLKAKSVLTLNGQVPSQLPMQQVQTAQAALMLLSQAIADKPEFEGIKVKLIKTIIDNMPLKGKEELMPLLEEMEKATDEQMAMAKVMEQLAAQMGGGQQGGQLPPELAALAGGAVPPGVPMGLPAGAM